MTPSLFSSPVELESRFAAGLADMLERHAGLGVYILVLANAAQDPRLWRTLRPALGDRHAVLAERIATSLRAGGRIAEPEDDLLVFLKLLAMGFEHLATVEQRVLTGDGPAWELQFNPIRALRPARMSQARVEGILRPFDPQGFHFNKPFLAKEALWEGELAGKAARLLYNKFPFAPLHGLLVPEPERELPQFLTPEFHGWAWDVAMAAGRDIPGFGLAYNSYGAYASVNHLHFQTFVREQPLPAAIAGDYPLARQRFKDAEAAWFHLDELHAQGRVYNLVYDAEGLLVLHRARQDRVPPEPWSTGFAWSETAGVFPVACREDYLGLDQATLPVALGRLTAEGA